MPLVPTGSSVTLQPRRASALQRHEHGLVLDGGGDQVLPSGGLERLGDAAQREVVGLGPAAREHDLGRLAPDQRRDGTSRIVQNALRALAEVVNARRIAELIPEHAHDHFQDAGIDRRRGVVVEIYPHENFPS